MKVDLRRRWMELHARLGASGDPDALYQHIAQRYGEPRRAYHGLAHLEHCFTELEGVEAACARPDEVAMALWMHDVVYSPWSSRNEARSAELFRDLAGAMRLPSPFIDAVITLILATRQHIGAAHPDASLFLDIDLAILGAPAFVFARYERDVRREVRWLPDFAYRTARLKFLKKFIVRRGEGTGIYLSETFRARSEADAMKNLARLAVALCLPHPGDEVHMDDLRIWTTRYGRLQGHIELTAVERVTVRTTDQGPGECDMFMELQGAGTKLIFPRNWPQDAPVQAWVMALPGLAFERWIDAMGSTSNATFVCWERAGQTT